MDSSCSLCSSWIKYDVLYDAIYIIDYSTRYLYVIRYRVAVSNVSLFEKKQRKNNAHSLFFKIILKKQRTQVCFY